MHWVGAQDGMLDAERELVLSEQTPADLVFLSAADTDLVALSTAWPCSADASLRLSHAAPLRQPVAADHFVQNVLRRSRLFIARLLGGRAYFPHLLQALADLRESSPRPRILLFSATESTDRDLESLNDFPPEVAAAMHALFAEGGEANLREAAAFARRLLDHDGLGAIEPPAVQKMPGFGWLREPAAPGSQGRVWITFYKAWQQTEDLAVVNALVDALEARGIAASTFYCQSLRETEVQRALVEKATPSNAPDALLVLQSFAMNSGSAAADTILEALDCPCIQVPVSSASRAAWCANPAGLAPAETAIQVALPELDGRVLATVAGFKEEHTRAPESECVLKRLQADPRQIEFIGDLVLQWVRLRRIPAAQKKIAVVLSNYPNRDGRIGNGVGLDTPASAVALLRALRDAGYEVTGIPDDGNALMRLLREGITNDPEASYGKQAAQFLESGPLRAFLSEWPSKRLAEMAVHWPESLPDSVPVAGVQFGNVFLGIQPPRGFSLQTQAIYHSPELPPPPAYIAFYQWIRTHFKADAIVHLGKHGNLEWLPGRAVALGEDDYPRLCLGPTPHFYPFIVNNPGEGTQAKRRTQAVIVDHLTPPLSRAGLYGQLEELERLLEEHNHCVTLYPKRAAELENQMQQLLESAPWREDLPQGGLDSVANFLCELKESQIRSGLHILGEAPAGERAIDFIQSLLRVPSGSRPGLLQALAGEPLDLETLGASERDALHERARAWVSDALNGVREDAEPEALQSLRRFVSERLLPLLHQSTNEIGNLLKGLAGGRVPPGPAGAPTRGRIDVLPTGRNFFALDPRIVPTPTAWRCGKALADSLLKRHFQDQGEHLKTLALVVWGTSNMRTGGDDLAQALWLWGCEPVWEEHSGRVVDFRILPASLLGRPRVDVTLRISGLFRDAFGDTVRLLAAIPKRLAALEEPESINPIRASFLREHADLVRAGRSAEAARRTAALRVFTSAPGCYGTGILPLLDAGNWETPADLAQVFVRWGHFAAGPDGEFTPEPEAFLERLKRVEAVAQNQDNREHDILDSDDYFQFQGGLHSTIKVLSGRDPVTYHGDSSTPESPKMRTLEEELVRVLHSRAFNPRWISAMKQHGYKGAFEIAATVDYLFGYSATTGLVRDHHFEAAAHTILLQEEAFFREHNPDALRESADKLLEAAERGLWVAPNSHTLDALETTVLSLAGERE